MAIDNSETGTPPGEADIKHTVADRWTSFVQARHDLAEVMMDDDLRDLGFNLDVLDEAS